MAGVLRGDGRSFLRSGLSENVGDVFVPTMLKLYAFGILLISASIQVSAQDAYKVVSADNDALRGFPNITRKTVRFTNRKRRVVPDH